MNSKQKRATKVKKQPVYQTYEQTFHTLKKHQKKNKSKSARKGNQIFQSTKYKKEQAKIITISNQAQIKYSNKAFTTDESYNCNEEGIDQMRLHKNKSQQRVKEEYFQNQVYKEKQSNTPDINYKNLSKNKEKLSKFFCKFNQLQKMMLSHDQQIAIAKQSLNRKQLGRLVTIHSSQKLKLLASIKDLSVDKRKSIRQK